MNCNDLPFDRPLHLNVYTYIIMEYIAIYASTTLSLLCTPVTTSSYNIVFSSHLLSSLAAQNYQFLQFSVLYTQDMSDTQLFICCWVVLG